MKYFKHFFMILILLISIISCGSKPISLGVSPGIIDIGTLERGTSKIVKFYITSTQLIIQFLFFQRTNLLVL